MGYIPAGGSRCSRPARGHAGSLRLGPSPCGGVATISGQGCLGPWVPVCLQSTQCAPWLLPAFCVPLGKVPQLSVPQFPPGTLGSQYVWCEVVGNILGGDTRKASGAVPAGAASVEWVPGAWVGAGLSGAWGKDMWLTVPLCLPLFCSFSPVSLFSTHLCPPLPHLGHWGWGPRPTPSPLLGIVFTFPFPLLIFLFPSSPATSHPLIFQH